MKEFKDHTFAICAYKESKFLEECIKSLKKQTMKSNIIMCTSTPNDFIKNLAKKYDIKLYINKGKSGIGPDWNFAVSKTETPLCTIAHQDDLYEKNYCEEIYKVYQKDKNFSIAFGDYREFKNGKKIELTKNLKIKKFLLRKLVNNGNSKKARLSALKYGNAICCPCVTVNKTVVGDKPYETDFKCNLDWATWTKFARMDYPFEYINKELMQHRIYSESTTSSLIENNVRLEEDYKMYLEFWPKPIAKLFMHFYKDAIKTNA